jgi:hypothetical protein
MPSPPTIIEQYDAQAKNTRDFLHLRNLALLDAYSAAAKTHLGYDPKNGVAPDTSLLNDDAIRAQVSNTMWDTAEAPIWSYVGSTSTDPLKRRHIVRAVGGISQEQITTYIGDQKDDFEPGMFVYAHLPQNDRLWNQASSNARETAGDLLDVKIHAKEVAKSVKLDTGSIDHSKISDVGDLVAILDARRKAESDGVPVSSKGWHKKAWYVA